VLMLTMLWSVNLRVMGRPNIALFQYDSVYSLISPAILANTWLEILFILALIVMAAAILFWFLKTEIGMSMRAIGANVTMAGAQGIDTWTYTVVGLGLANALNAFGGAIIVQNQGYADVSMGFGVLIQALASLIIGESLVGRRTVLRQVLAPVVGAVVYFQIISLGLALGLNPSDLRLVTGIFIIITLGLPALRGRPAALRDPAIRE